MAEYKREQNPTYISSCKKRNVSCRTRYFILAFCLFAAISFGACGKDGGAGESVNDYLDNGETGEEPDWQGQYDLGVRLLSEGNYQEAIIAFTAAIRIEPKKADAYLKLAEAYVGNGQLQEARQILEGAPEDVDNPTAVQEALEAVQKLLEEGQQQGQPGQQGQEGQQEQQEQQDAALLESMTEEEQIEYYLEKTFDTEHQVQEEPVALFGQDVRMLTIEQFKEISIEYGWVPGESAPEIGTRETGGMANTFYEPRHDPVKATGTAGQGGGNILWQAEIGFSDFDLEVSDRMDAKEKQELAELMGKETGFLDLRFGDSLETVLEELGVENVEEVAGIVRSAEEETRAEVSFYHTGEELEPGKVYGSGIVLECGFDEAGRLPTACIQVFTSVKTSEESSGIDADGQVSVELYFGDADMVLCGIRYLNGAASVALFGE